jgi:hypothetical protein
MIVLSSFLFMVQVHDMHCGYQNLMLSSYIVTIDL